jgi:hypothetical protein
MMRDSKDDNALGLDPIEERETEPFDNDATRIAARR